MLEKIFDEQRKLVEYLEADRYPKRTEERVSALMTAIIHEATELQDLTSWKWWKRPSGFEIERAQTELIDILHFVIQAALELQMTPQKLLNTYMNKNYVNRERKRSGYWSNTIISHFIYRTIQLIYCIVPSKIVFFHYRESDRCNRKGWLGKSESQFSHICLGAPFIYGVIWVS